MVFVNLYQTSYFGSLELVTLAWNPVAQSAVYCTVRTFPSGSTKEYSP